MFFAMEFVEGKDLDGIIVQHLANDEWVPMPRALTILEDAAAGLHAIHAAGHVHRDVKPANLVIEEATGRPVVVDLGLALSMEEARAGQMTQGVGTPAYAAPEQIGTEVDPRLIGPRTDVYSFACTAFELFCGRPPFVSDDPDVVVVQQLTVEPPPLSRYRPGMTEFDDVFMSALAKDPAERPASAPDFVRQLREAAGVTSQRRLPSLAPLADVLRVLVVDDDPDFCTLIAACANIAFRDAKVQVEAVTSGHDALQKVETFRPHLLLLDYLMPRLNGIETLTQLRALPFGEAIRVVVVSAHDQRWRFSVLGVNDFIVKGESPSALTQSLRQVRDKYGFTSV
jgi:serine/threonine-protein kinase